MIGEPYGHRGHPTSGEKSQARYVRERLGAAIGVLVEAHGFTRDEAVCFVCAYAYEVAARGEERWHGPASCKLTIERMLAGKAAKFWSLRVLTETLDELKEAI